MAFLLSRRGVLMATAAVIPDPGDPGDPGETAVRYDFDQFPADGYALLFDDTGFERSNTNTNWRRWLLTDRVIGDIMATSYRGSYYWEQQILSSSGNVDGYHGPVAEPWWPEYSPPLSNPINGGSLGWRGNGSIWGPSGSSQTSSVPTYTAGDRLMLCFNPFTGELWVGKNGVWNSDPDTDPPDATTPVDLLDGGVLFRICGQARDGDDSQRMFSTTDQFAYATPDSAIPLGAEDPPLVAEDLRITSQNTYQLLRNEVGKISVTRVRAYMLIQEE